MRGATTIGANLIAGCVATAIVLCPDSAFGQDVSPHDVQKGARQHERDRIQTLEQDLWAKSIVVRFEARVQETDNLLKELVDGHVKLLDRSQKLLTSDDGKRLALDPAAALHFVSLQEQPLIRESDMKAKRAFIDSMLEFLAKQKQRPEVGYTPEPDRIVQTDDAFLWARERLAKITEINAWLDEALAKCDREADVSKQPTLGERIRTYIAARRQLWLDSLVRGETAAREAAAPEMEAKAYTAELERALQEAKQLLAEARMQIERNRIASEVQLKEQEADLLERMAAARRNYDERVAQIERENQVEAASRTRRDVEAGVEASEIKEEAERIRLVRKCQSAEVQRDLKAFLTTGVWQPGDGNTKVSFDRTPMSFSKIMEYGALEKTPEGLIQLLAIANATGGSKAKGKATTYAGKHHDQDRPKWGYDKYLHKLSQGDIDELRRLQALLIELGPTLVEEGMLAK
jgi:hypothetical protein